MQVHLVADGAVEAWSGAVLDLVSVTPRNRVSQPSTAPVGDSQAHWRAGASLPPSTLPAGLGAEHSPSCSLHSVLRGGWQLGDQKSP